MKAIHPQMRLVVSIVAVIASIVLAAGCTPVPPAFEATPKAIAPPARPDEPRLSTPLEAIRSYTDWISYAYRVMDSNVATHAFSEYEEVNVNSYVQYNMMESRGLEQSLQRSDYDVVKSTDSSATVVGTEYWLYRYFALDQSKYLTGPLEASYDITYTVVRKPDGRWLVDKVEASRTDKNAGVDAPDAK